MDCSGDVFSFLSQNILLPDSLINKVQHGTNHEFLTALAEAALSSDFTECIFAHFETLSLELCARWAVCDVYTVAAGFARVLPVLPLLSNVLYQIFSSHRDLDLLSSLKDGDDQECREHNRSLLLAVSRLLSFDNDRFARFIRPAKLQWYMQHDDRSVRYLAIRIICQYMYASDAVLEDMKSKYLGPGPASGMLEQRGTIDFEFLPLWENKRLSQFTSLVKHVRDLRRNSSSPVTKPQRVIEEKDLSDNVALVAGVLLYRHVLGNISRENSQHLVSTSTTKSNLQLIAGAIAGSQPILLTGLAGCGKTALVKHMAERLNKSSSMITLHLNEQSDAKLLIGIYTTGSQPGSFEWRPGVLATAVKEGRWVLVEDLDRAPNEVMSTLLPLIERGELSIPSRGETIVAAPGFKLIATMRSMVNLRGEQVASTGRLLGRRLWHMISLHSLKIEELGDIITAQYPLLSSLMEQIMAIYAALTSETIIGSTSSKSQFKSRPISPRELLKWAGRINAVLQRQGSETPFGSISEDKIDSIFLDAVDCFAGHLEDLSFRTACVSVIAKELHIDPQRRQYLVSNRAVSFRYFTTSVGKELQIGRTFWNFASANKTLNMNQSSSTFALNGHSLRLLERVAVAVEQREPLLLVGETGIGKTVTIQQLSGELGNKLVAINLSQQSEAGDLLGGFRPVNMRTIAIPLKDEFDSLFDVLFSQKKNQDFSQQLSKCLVRGQWKRAVTLWRAALKKAEAAFGDDGNASSRAASANGEQQNKRRKVRPQFPSGVQVQLESFSRKLDAFERQLLGPSNAFRFSYVEGKLITAVREGHWVLLDEINLASSDTLECLSELLDFRPSILLAETGNAERIFAHQNFRIFAAMNPANDVGKNDLPLGIRSRFTEVFVDSPDSDFQSLRDIAKAYVGRLSAGSSENELAAKVAELFQQIQSVTKVEGLVDGSGEPAHFSLRTLTRALAHACIVVPQCSVKRAIYEGFCLCFFTCLDAKCEARVQQLVKSGLFSDNSTAKAELRKSLRPPQLEEQFTSIVLRIEAMDKSKQKAQEEKYWLPKGHLPPEDPSSYIITPYVMHNLHNLIRAAFTRKYPVLIQGPTSAGKTSMIEYLAKRSGNEFVRINNHEHTDLQEYLGTYISTPEGNLIFQEGVLVEAVRSGHWVVLDELNLAPSDVLEALNRLLDDNRELMIPETQEVVKAHRNFMLFATQNPAGPYGGRKMLSRAFRNRFVELHFDDIPVEELNIILSRRSNLPASWCGLIVEVYKRLSTLRQEQRLFETNSFATLRDLFRWAFRGAESVEELAAQGYMLLAEKVRKPEERQSIKSIIEQTMTRKGVKVQIDDDSLYVAANCPEIELYDQSRGADILWTKAMRRLFVLVSHAIRHNEPVLLVGETGCGKTTVCQMLAQAVQKEIHIVNAHQNTETGDLIGAQRPIRNRSAVDEELMLDLRDCLSKFGEEIDFTKANVDSLLESFDMLTKDELKFSAPDVCSRIAANRMKRKALFEWSNGSLVQAMQSGTYYLLDEISLAEDSVLERLNSVLDPQRSLLLAEKGSNDALVFAKEGFQFFATMNPGGDFGKRELSPALRNRFTEIWVPPISDEEDVSQIVNARLTLQARQYSAGMVGFSKWFSETYSSFKVSTISIRDLLAWIEFINSQPMDPLGSVVHGAAMVYIDTLGANPSAILEITGEAINLARSQCIQQLSHFLRQDVSNYFLESPGLQRGSDILQIGHFAINCGRRSKSGSLFHFDTPTTKLNAMRILRALQLVKPILLEGSPGVGKTSIITAIANTTGRSLTRINLSDQTDLMDLFGSDVPIENMEAGRFSWRDAPFLTAMKRGDWVLLDEMNLASQSVLEGLNACLDHRGEAYIAELDQTFARHPDFRLFAAQNPHHQGGGRKGLPASFVNRFTVVYVDAFKPEDLQLICARVVPPQISPHTIGKVIEFVTDINYKVTIQRKFGTRGAPWEFNLRDILRWLQLLSSPDGLLPAGAPDDYLDILFTQRFRTDLDIQYIRNIFSSIIDKELPTRSLFANISSKSAQIGHALLQRQESLSAQASLLDFRLKPRLAIMESLMLCVQQNWPVILVGGSGVGKSSLLKALSSIGGAELEIFSLNADIDATDLVGGFEQVDVSRQIQTFLDRIRRFCISQSRELLLKGTDRQRAMAIGILFTLLSRLRTAGDNRTNFLQLQDLFAQYLALGSSEEGALLSQSFESLASKPWTVGSAMFEWIDGTLVTALERGRWLVLDNANLCSSSVLDRINSLLEPDGSLIITEHCNEDGTARSIKPHKNFRIFLTVDPQYGELSRAMRNRAVEIFVPELPKLSNEALDETMIHIESEPLMTSFQGILDLTNAEYPSSSFNTILEKSLERLPIKDIELLPRFAQQASLGLASTDRLEVSAAIKESFEVGAHLHRGQVVSSGFYKFLQEKLQLHEDFSSSQPCHVLTNEPLAAYGRITASQFDTLWLGRLQDFLQDFARMDLALKSSRSSPSTPERRTRLQRSFGSTSIANTAKESTFRVAQFLMNVQMALVEWVRYSFEECRSDWGFIEIISNIKSCWWTIFLLVSSVDFDEARFRTLVILGSKDVERAKPVTPGAISLVKVVTKELKGFDQAVQLTTGFSMERLWKFFRPNTVSSIDRLHSLLQLEELADRFDRVVWQIHAPFSEVVGLRRSIVGTIELAFQRKVAVDTISKGLEDALASLRTNKQNEDLSVQPLFKDSFEYVVQLLEIRNSEGPYDRGGQQANEQLRLLACRSTKSSGSGKRISTESILFRLSQFLQTFATSARTVVESVDFGLGVLRQLRKSDDVSLSRLSLLQAETRILGNEVAGKAEILGITPLPHLFSMLVHLVQAVLLAHQDLLQPHFVERMMTHGLHSFLENVDGDNDFIQSVLLPSAAKGRNEPRKLISRMLYTFALSASNTDWSSSEALFRLSDCFTTFSLVALLLYVPDKIFDPILREQAELQIYDQKRQHLQEQCDALAFVENFFTGKVSSLRHEICKDEIKRLGPAPPVLEIVRPTRFRLDEVQLEFSHVVRLTKAVFDAWSEGHRQRLEDPALTSNVSAVIRRLSNSLEEYRDLTEPALRFLMCLRIGLSLHQLARDQKDSPIGREYSLFQQPFLTSLPGFSEAHRMSVTQNGIPFSNSPHEDRILVLQSYALRSGVQSPEEWPFEAKQDLFGVINSFFDDWKNQLTAEQKKAKADSSFYRYRGGQEDADVEEEQQFNKLFPDFDGDSNETDSDHTPLQGNSAQKLAPVITDVLSAVFLEPDEPVHRLERMFEHASSLVTESHVENISPRGLFDARQVLPMLILRIQQKEHELRLETRSNTSYNVYADRNIREAQRMANFVYDVEDRFHDIVQIWPEHATLHNVLSVCKELLSFKHTDPIMKFLTKAEQLHSYIAEWQSVASREFSAELLFNRLTDILVSWRQLELSTWAKLLELEMDKCTKDAQSWFFVAYENVCSIPESLAMSSDEMSSHAAEVIATLETFLVGSTIGQFEAKLQILKTLYRLISTSFETSQSMWPIQNALGNFVDYFIRYVPAVRSRILHGRQILEKQLKDILQLASWKDRNIAALKQSAKSSHRRLFRVIRKYRDLLAQPLNEVLNQEPSLPENVEPKSAFRINLDEASLLKSQEAAIFCQQRSDYWHTLPQRLRNIPSTLSIMQSKTEMNSNVTLIASASQLESIIDNLELSVNELKNETPATLTKDNASFVKHLLTRKRRLFADTMKELRQMGLTSNPSSAVLAGQNSLGSILSKVSRLERSDIPVDFQDAHDFLHSTINEMPSIRQAKSDHNDDLSNSEIVRSVGFIESLLALTLRQRNIWSLHQTQLRTLESALLQVKNLWSHGSSNVLPCDRSETVGLNLTARMTKWLPTVVKITKRMLSAQAELGDLNFSEITEDLTRRAESFESLGNTYRRLPKLPLNLCSAEHTTLSETYDAAINSFSEAVNKWLQDERYKPASVVLNHLKSWMHGQRTEAALHSTAEIGSDHFESSEFDQAVLRVVDLVLGAIQDIEHVLSSLKQSNVMDKEWLIQHCREFGSLIRSFHLSTITRAFQDILPLLYRTGISKAGYAAERLDDASAILTLVLPVFDKYHQLCAQVMYRYAALHRATCRASYRLAKTFSIVASQGFCRPAESSNEQGTVSEKLESGTGLGEGEGAEDISKDIGDDEDLSELAQDPENRKEDGKLQTESDAVDVEDDLEGTAGEDAEAQDDEAEEGVDDGRSGSDMESQDGSVGDGQGAMDEKEAEAKDDEVGDIDDLGPSAVDEKMWDQAADEDKKTKEGKQQMKNVDTDDLAAAGEADEASEDAKADEAREQGDQEETDGETDVEMPDDAAVGSENEEGAMDPHVKESEGFELPEELQLDGDKGQREGFEADDSDEDLLDTEDDKGGNNQESQDDGPDAKPLEDEGPKDNETTLDEQQDNTGADEAANEDDSLDTTTKPEADESFGDQDAVEASNGTGGAQVHDNEQEKPNTTDLETTIQGVGPDQTNEEEMSTEKAAQREAGAESQASKQPQSQNRNGINASQESALRESRDRQTVRKLGSLLEQWHKQQREIYENSLDDKEERQSQEDVDMTGAEFEHLPAEDARADTQALGAADEEQARALDESMAIAGPEQEKREPDGEALPDADEDSNGDVDMHDQASTTEGQPVAEDQNQAGALVGKRAEQPVNQFLEDAESAELEQVDDQLSSMQLQAQDKSPTRSISPDATSSDVPGSWAYHESRTHALSLALTSQLRLILAPTLATKLRGDFRTGKRLNIKRIIPYIASSYKRDKIWMRRSVPTKRAYQVMLAIDDSKSMVDDGAGNTGTTAHGSSKDMAFDTLALISRGLSMLEVGEISVVGFGERVFVAHDFGSPLTSEAGANVLRHFTFEQQRTDVKRLVQESIEIFREARAKSVRSGSSELWQLELIISDGICEDHEGIRRLLLQAREERIMVVFVIVDALVSGASVKGQGPGQGQSIVDLERVEFVATAREGVEDSSNEEEGDMKVVRTKYLESFPFAYYLVVKDVKELPHVLATALRQWFAEVADK